MKVLAFIRAMRWKGFIIAAVVTAALGLILTIYSCNKPQKVKKETTEEVMVNKPDVKEEACTVESCVIK